MRKYNIVGFLIGVFLFIIIPINVSGLYTSVVLKNSLQESTTLIGETFCNDDGLPDLVIEDMIISPSNDPWQEKFSCQVKNVGNASVPYGKVIDITVTVRWKIFGLIPLKIIRQFDGGTISSGLDPGEMDKITFAGSNQMPVFGFYSFYCVVDPEQIIDESNNLNNDYTETVFFLLGASLP